jgi:hypothetical protein
LDKDSKLPSTTKRVIQICPRWILIYCLRLYWYWGLR